jgi:hypothetical protein
MTAFTHTQRTIIYRPVVTVTVTINADGILAAMVRIFYLLGLGRLRVWLRWQWLWVGAAGKLGLKYCCVATTQQYNRAKSAFYLFRYGFGAG